MESAPNELARVIAFHGHNCPGLMIGYRAARLALRELNVTRAVDEELVAICETDACGVDAVQVLTGCTLGKGNLILLCWGKQVFTFGRRSDGKMLRVALRYGVTAQDPERSPEERSQAALARLQTAADDELYSVRWVAAPLPEEARIFKTVQCSRCGEGVMEALARLEDGRPVCPACRGAVYTRHW